MSYTKPWKSYEEQLSLLAERGMEIADPGLARDCLARVGYYRLSGYWYPFRERSGQCVLLDEHGQRPGRIRVETIALDRFLPGTQFSHAVDLYVFDRRLRALVSDAIERIEVALRVDVSHQLGGLDPFAYLNPELFHSRFSRQLDPARGVSRHHEWLSRHARLISRSREEFVHHNRLRYGLPLAIWVACEVWDFGTLSTLYGGMREVEQDAISHRYGVSNGRVFATWLRSLNYLRNVCAHHARLWNRNIIDQPRLPPATEVPWVASIEHDVHARARCFLLLRIAAHLMRVIEPDSDWPGCIRDHLHAFPELPRPALHLPAMGVPADWEAHW